MAYAIARGLLLAWLVPPWQGPDEPGHAEHAMLLAGRPPAGVAADDVQAAILRSMDAHDFWQLAEAEAPDPPALRFDDVPWLAGEVSQRADETPLGYLPMVAALRMGRDGHVEALLRRMRLASVGLVALLAVAALAAARAALPLPAAAPAALVAIALPMVGFAGAIANNDLAAAALATAWLAAALALVRRPTVPGLAAVAALALAAAAAKRTGLYALGMLPVAGWLAWRTRQDAPVARVPAPPRRARVALGFLATIAGLASLAAWPLAGRAPGWTVVGEGWGDARGRESARSGRWGLRIVDDRTDGWQYLERWWPVRGGESVEATAWLRPGTGRASLALSDDAGTWAAELVGPAGEGWVPARVRAELPDGARALRLAIVPGDGTREGVGAVDADDLSLAVAGRERLPNGGVESPARLGAALAAWAVDYADLPRMAASLEPAMADPAGALRRLQRGLAFTLQSLWGGFGWLKVWPPPAYGWLAGAVTAWAMAGLAAALVAPRRLAGSVARDGEPDGAEDRDDRDARTGRGEVRGAPCASPAALRLCAAAALAAIAIAVLGSLAGTGDGKLPQGRYLVAAVVPLALPAAALAERAAGRLGAPAGAGAWALAAAIVILDVWAIAGVMAPAWR